MKPFPSFILEMIYLHFVSSRETPCFLLMEEFVKRESDFLFTFPDKLGRLAPGA